jgi:hypothetical protein
VASDNTHFNTDEQRFRDTERQLESKEAEINAQLQAQTQEINEKRGRHLSYLDEEKRQFHNDQAALKQEIKEAERQHEAAKRSASEHCANIGLRYVPDTTTENDILKGRSLEEADAATKLDLPFGTGFEDTRARFIKPILMLLCWLMSALSLGLGFRLLDPKDILANPATLVLSLVMGGVVALGLLLAITPLWRLVGIKVGSSRPTEEVIWLLIPVAAVTMLLLLGLANLDAKALLLLNAAPAALNPARAIPLGVAMLIGAVISGVYVLGMAGTAFAEGYTTEARKRIQAAIKEHENRAREEAKKTVPNQRTLAVLGEVENAKARVQDLKNQLKTLQQGFKHELDDIIGSLPDAQTTLTPEQRQELNNLRERVRSEKIRLDAHMATRGDASRNGNAT